MSTRALRTASLFALLAVAAPGQGENAAVNVEIWTPAEETLRSAVVTLTELGTRRQVGVFRDGRAAAIPYGEYILQVQSPGFRTFEQRVGIYQPEFFRRILLRVANTDSAVLRGVIKPTTEGALNDWVKLVSIRSNNTPSLETRVLSDGSFEVSGMDGGDYLLLVIRGMKVIYTEELTLYGTKGIEIIIPMVGN